MKHAATKQTIKRLAPKQTAATPRRWVEVEAAGALQRLADLDGVSWSEAPVPPRWHRCKPQSQGFLSVGIVYRCACGAISKDGHWWSRRNSRRQRAAAR